MMQPRPISTPWIAAMFLAASLTPHPANQDLDAASPALVTPPDPGICMVYSDGSLDLDFGVKVGGT